MAEIFTPAEPLDRLTDIFIDHTITESAKRFANGEGLVNNHLDGGYDEVKSSDLRVAVTSQAASMVMRCAAADFDCIVPVPMGAVGWGYAITRVLKDPSIFVVSTEKDSENKRSFNLTTVGENQVEILHSRHEKPKALVIDDVTSDGGTNEAMADYLVELGFEVTLVMSLFYRGDFERLLDDDRKYKRAVLMQRQIPYEINWKLRRTTGLIVPLSAVA